MFDMFVLGLFCVSQCVEHTCTFNKPIGKMSELQLITYFKRYCFLGHSFALFW